MCCTSAKICSEKVTAFGVASGGYLPHFEIFTQVVLAPAYTVIISLYTLIVTVYKRTKRFIAQFSVLCYIFTIITYFRPPGQKMGTSCARSVAR